MPNTSAASQPTPAMTFRRTDLVRSIFSFPVMCVFLLSAVVYAFCVKQFAEPDIWWHLRNAQNLIESHSFAHRHLLLYCGGLVAPEFRMAVRGSLLPCVQGLGTTRSSPGVDRGFSSDLCRGLLPLLPPGADCKDAVIATMLAISLGVVSIGPRMLLFGWLCMVVLLILLDVYRRSGRGLWAIPPLFLLLDQSAWLLVIWNGVGFVYCFGLGGR